MNRRTTLYYAAGLLIGVLLWLGAEIVTRIRIVTLPNGFGVALTIISILATAVLDIKETQNELGDQLARNYTELRDHLAHEQSELRDRLAFDQKLYEDRWLLGPLGEIIDSYTGIVRKYQNNPKALDSTSYKLAQRHITGCVSQLEELNKGQWPVDDKAQRMELLINVVNAARDQIYVTCDVDFTTWWQSPHGEQYLQANLDAARRGVKIKRIFIISHATADALPKQLPEAEQLFKIIEKQEKGGIEIKVAIEDELSQALQPSSIHNLIICDNNFAAWSPINASDGGNASVNQDDIEHTKQRFNKVLILSKDPTAFTFYDRFSAGIDSEHA
jgi:hypothetical protein